MMDGRRRELEAWLAARAGADRVTIVGARKLSGGAIQENWAVDVEAEGGPMDGAQALVVRTDAPSGVVASRSEEHTSELQSLMRISYAVFCLKKKKKEIILYNTKHISKRKHTIVVCTT